MKYFRLIGVLSLLVFSFYLTDFVTELAISSNPLMKTIRNNSEAYKVESVNAYIENNTIIPGIKGRKINDLDSFLNMKDFGTFNINYLIYDDIKPDISIEDNKEKIIISGNKSIRQVSILLKDNSSLINYLNNKNIKYTKLIKSVDEIVNGENINIISDNKLFLDLDTILNKKDLNKGICILNYSNIDNCKKENYYIVKPSLSINNNNFVSELKSVSSGSIIFIDDNFTLDNFNILLNKLSSSDLKIVYLSEIIKE